MKLQNIFKDESFLFVRLLIYIVLAVVMVNIYTYWPVSPIKASADDSQDLKANFSNVATPTTIVIPRIGLRSKIEPVQKTESGNLDVPKDLRSVGWYSLGPKPGDIGNAVIDGHEVDQFGLGVVFKHLDKLKMGDIIEVQDDNEKKIRFEVTRTAIYDYDNAPLADIFGNTTSKNLNLITCKGNFVRKIGTKDMRLVVYSTRIET